LGGILKGQKMLRYNENLKDRARQLRKNMTDSESVLWSRVRRKQLMDIQFYRQKSIGKYIVDFFAPRIELVVEVDGSQHMGSNQLQRDQKRNEYIADLGLKVLRFNSNEVLIETDAVVEVILRAINEKLNSQIPPHPPFSKGEMEGRDKGELGGI
jgi:very-short-patch-repair endonuclease